MRAMRQPRERLEQSKMAILEELTLWNANILASYDLDEGFDGSICDVPASIRPWIAYSTLLYLESVMLLTDESVSSIPIRYLRQY